ncbi:MAG: hypothetical protein H6710_20900 [Myxococcales bacterium]|nr:hypothetical protein [Myxococcales bacterium]MCB9706477.1 hypothetical protein [Myxococcales bacterium]
MLRIISFISLLVLGIALVIGYVVVSPWVALPEEAPEVIEARWAEVSAWAAPHPSSAGSIDHLAAALAELQRSSTAEALERGASPLGDDDLDEPLRRALAELVTWQREGGGLGPHPCVVEPGQEETFPIIGALRLGEVAIRRAEGPEDPRLVAALDLAAALRDRGGLLFGLIGATLADTARERAEASGWAPAGALRERAPTRDEIFPLVAREALCSVLLVENAASSPELLEAQGSGWRRLIQERVGIERELAMLKWYQGKRLHAAHAVADDPNALADALAAPTEEELPPSLLLRALLVDTSPRIRDYGEKVAAYEAFLRRPAPPPVDAAPPADAPADAPAAAPAAE